jgi:hypothetical protein
VAAGYPLRLLDVGKIPCAASREVARIRRARGKAWQSDEMIHTLLDLMKIRVPEYDERKSLLWEETDEGGK